MRRLAPHAVLALVLVSFASVMLIAMDEASRRETEEWRKKHEADYRREYVPLAGLFSLKPGPNTVGSAASNDIVLPKQAPPRAGRFILDGKVVRFEPQAGAAVMLRGRPVTGTLTLRSDASEELDELAIGDLALWVHISG